MYTDVYDIGFFCFRLYDLGHQIVGVEVAEQALEQFFKEHQLEFSVKPLAGGGKLYEACLGIFVNRIPVSWSLLQLFWNHDDQISTCPLEQFRKWLRNSSFISNEIWVNIGSCNGLLPDSTKSLPELT